MICNNDANNWKLIPDECVDGVKRREDLLQMENYLLIGKIDAMRYLIEEFLEVVEENPSLAVLFRLSGQESLLKDFRNVLKSL